MSVTVNMWSKKPGELENFLRSFYQTEVKISGDARQWIEEYKNPLKSVDIISALMDNRHKFDIVLYVQVGQEDLYRITEENYNDVIKGIFILFYDKKLIFC